ncbi:MAG: oligopeptide transporter, OPT family [Bdellovibrionales bacterium CG10_big_fil_rev_8_21_14_0_10_45_34]|nr:MAG: oligopeptide transporter, OPT family [Bdellovibrionales bacterium CG10_big_fil_rev_8_21_14_0_10_45_34]
MSFKPFVAAKAAVAELTPVSLISGVLLGILFGASSLYLALKVGMTVSASIPIAVLSVTLFRAFSKAFGVRRATILENNMVQTTGSAGESIAFGVAVTMPALLLMGYEMELSRTMVIAVLGGFLGVLMMIPLRRALIVKEHGQLSYPEGTACAEVLIVGEQGGTSAITVFTGFFVGLFYKFLNVGTHLWKDISEKSISWYRGATLEAEVSPELLGVGYIIGPKIASIMVGGGVLSSLVLIPMIYLFGDGLVNPLFPATKLISEMSTHEVWRNYVLYIGAGAVATGGIISLFQSLPTIVRGAVGGLSAMRGSTKVQNPEEMPRTDKDLPMSVVVVGSLVLVLVLMMWPGLNLNPIAAILIVLFGFLFVTVSARLTGQIGSSSNPISGMTVATLLLTCLIFVLLGWVGEDYRVAALSIAAIVCVAASVGGTTSQDLKTGYLVGASPWKQQIGLIIGTLTSALVIGLTLNVLNSASTIYSQKNLPETVVDVSTLAQKESPRESQADAVSDNNSYFVLRVGKPATEGPLAGIPAGKYLVDDTGKIRYLVDPGINGVLRQRDDGTPVAKYDAPKASLMALIIDGILTQKLPWGLVLLGAFISVVLELCGISALPFAVGVYLPLSASAPIFVGGLVRWLVERVRKPLSQSEGETSSGVLLSSGLIAGGAIAGIALAILALQGGFSETIHLGSILPGLSQSDGFALTAFLGLATFVFFVGTGKLLGTKAR